MSDAQIAIITNFPAAVFQRDVIVGAREVFDNCGYGVRIIEVPQVPARADDLSFAGSPLAGALVIANVLPDLMLEALLERGLPLSLVSHQAPNGRIPGVMTNNRQGIAMLLEHLVIACGRRKPIFIRGIMTQNDSIQRETAFQQEVMRYNLNITPHYYLNGEFDAQIAASAMQAFLSTNAEFDAVVASDYLMAEAAISVIKADGRRIPEDIAVVGFGDGPEAARAGITTVAADVTELGRRGARQLLGQIEGLRIRGLTLLSTELIERETTSRAS